MYTLEWFKNTRIFSIFWIDLWPFGLPIIKASHGPLDFFPLIATKFLRITNVRNKQNDRAYRIINQGSLIPCNGKNCRNTWSQINCLIWIIKLDIPIEWSEARSREVFFGTAPFFWYLLEMLLGCVRFWDGVQWNGMVPFREPVLVFGSGMEWNRLVPQKRKFP